MGGEGQTQRKEFAEKSHRKGAGADGGVADLDIAEAIVEVAGEDGRKRRGVAGVEERFDHGCFLFRASLGQIGEEGAPAHVADDFLRGVEGALVLVVLKEVLEDAAEHLGVDADFGFVGVVLVDGEVVFGEELQETFEELGREFHAKLVEVVAFEEAAVEVGDAALADAGDAGDEEVVLRSPVGVEGVEEKAFEDVVEKVVLLFGG